MTLLMPANRTTVFFFFFLLLLSLTSVSGSHFGCSLLVAKFGICRPPIWQPWPWRLHWPWGFAYFCFGGFCYPRARFIINLIFFLLTAKLGRISSAKWQFPCRCCCCIGNYGVGVVWGKMHELSRKKRELVEEKSLPRENPGRSTCCLARAQLVKIYYPELIS